MREAMTYGLPVYHPAVLLALVGVVLGYIGLGLELVALYRGDSDGLAAWVELAIAGMALPVIAHLLLRVVARPVDFVKESQSVVGIVDQPKKLGRVRATGYLLLVLWVGTLLYIGFIQ